MLCFGEICIRCDRECSTPGCPVAEATEAQTATVSGKMVGGIVEKEQVPICSGKRVGANAARCNALGGAVMLGTRPFSESEAKSDHTNRAQHGGAWLRHRNNRGSKMVQSRHKRARMEETIHSDAVQSDGTAEASESDESAKRRTCNREILGRPQCFP
jgi:hypothetical protein